MKRWLVVGAAVGAIGPVLIPFTIALRLYLPDVLWLSLFPFAIGMMETEHLPAATQWARYGGLALLNVTVFAGMGAALCWLVRLFKRGGPR